MFGETKKPKHRPVTFRIWRNRIENVYEHIKWQTTSDIHIGVNRIINPTVERRGVTALLASFNALQVLNHMEERNHAETYEASNPL